MTVYAEDCPVNAEDMPDTRVLFRVAKLIYHLVKPAFPGQDCTESRPQVRVTIVAHRYIGRKIELKMQCHPVPLPEEFRAAVAQLGER